MALSPHLGPYLALFEALGLGLSLEDPDCPGGQGKAAQPEDKVAVKGPQGSPAQDPPLLSSTGPQSLHVSPRNESVRAWVQGDMVEGQLQREGGSGSVQ